MVTTERRKNMTTAEKIEQIVENHRDCRWLDASELEALLKEVAEHQKAIDVDKACKWFRAYLLETCEEAVGYASLTENLVDSLRKAMED